MTGPDLTLLRPLWLLAVPVIVLFGWWLSRRRSGLGDWQNSVDPALLQAMAALGRVDNSAGRAPTLAMLTALMLIVLGLAGPAVERREAQSFRNLDGVLFVVDVSPSVTNSDRWPQMLTMGRFGLAALGTRPGGLIVYAGDAYVATDMTLDHLQLGQTLSLLSAETVPDKGSRPALALELAAGVLRQGALIAGDVILFTDGDALDPESLQAAGAIVAQNARLSVVALDDISPAIQTLADVGQGQVFAAEETDALADWLRRDARMKLQAQDYPLLFWHDLGRWFLGIALIPLFFLFRSEPA